MRWAQVLDCERRDGLVIVDTDPFKLPFVWTLLRTGLITEIEWTLQREVAQEGFAAGRYVLADLFVVADIDLATLRARRNADASRTRGNFERQAAVRQMDRRWYSAVDRLDPGRVTFGLPEGGLAPALLAKGQRHERTGRALFDRLMAELARL